MKRSFIIEKLNITGDKCQILTIRYDGEELSEFDKFLTDHEKKYPKNIDNVVIRISLMKKRNGCPDVYFKDVSSPKDALCRLRKTGKLRLYCLRFGNAAIIIGGGGVKEDDKRTYQEVEELNDVVEDLKFIYSRIEERIRNRDLKITDEGLSGDLNFDIEEEDINE